MKTFHLPEFGIDNLSLDDVATPEPGAGEVRIRVRATSINFRDLMIVRGHYNPRLALPAVPLSDGAGEISAVGDGVDDWQVGDRVMTHFVADWQDGPFRGEYLATTLGTPGPGLAAEEVVLPAHAVMAIPEGFDFAAAATLPIAALTAWSALVTEGRIERGQRVLTLGTGGVSIFAVQLGAALGADVVVTSSSDDKIARAIELGAVAGINYREHPDWDKASRDHGPFDLVVENGGVGTLSQSLRAVAPGGTIAMLGALTGLAGEVDIAPILMKRVRVAGIMVDSRAVFADLVEFLAQHPIEPVISERFSFDQLPAALHHMASGSHFGKIVLVG